MTMTTTHPVALSALQKTKGLWPKWSKYIPHRPTSKQLAFLMLPHKEAFYGGAAGGGKSDALLMGALQYADIPGYAAIIFRKTFADLTLPGALIDRSHEWLESTDARWDGQQHTWRFPSGAQVAFGYLQSELHKFRYQSAEFQYIAFDELTQHWEDDYLYLFSRLRRLSGYPVPLRMRAASNPGGVGHIWVKSRFRITRGINDTGSEAHYRGTHPDRPHIPAFIRDNPHLDVIGYEDSLSELDPVTREQLKRGDWGVSADGRFRKAWAKYYSIRGRDICLGRGGLTGNKTIPIKQCRVFMTVDPAASVREGPADAQVWRRAPSSTAISVWLLTPNYHLLWWDLDCFRQEIPDVVSRIVDMFNKHRKRKLQPDFVGVEANGLGIGVYQYLQRLGLPMRDLRPRSVDKLVRATDAITRMENGMIWFPEEAPWLEDCEAEVFTWTAHPAEPSDRIDTLAYAAMEVSREAGQTASLLTTKDMPTAW